MHKRCFLIFSKAYNAENKEISQAVEAQSDILETQGKQKRKRVYQFSEEEDFESDMDMDSNYIPQAAVHDESSDSSDSTMSRKKKRRNEKKEKRMWSEEEKRLLKPLVNHSLRSGKPPVKSDITSLQRSNTTLQLLPWLKIKHQVWAIAQAEKNKNKKIMKELKL